MAEPQQLSLPGDSRFLTWAFPSPPLPQGPVWFLEWPRWPFYRLQLMLIMSPINVVAGSAWMLTVPGTALIPPRRGHPHHHPRHHRSHLTGARTDQFNDLPKVTKPGRGGARLASSPELT